MFQAPNAGISCPWLRSFYTSSGWWSLNYSISSVEKVSGPGAVSFTFDDGHISNYSYVFPVLAEHGLSGTFFIVADWVGKAGRIDTSQLREMSANGMSIGSHGLTHTSLAGLSRDALDRELAGSKDRLEQLLGTEVTTIALPRGLMDRQVLERARIAGYRLVCTSNAGLMSGGYAVPRLSVTSYTSVEPLRDTLAGIRCSLRGPGPHMPHALP